MRFFDRVKSAFKAMLEKLNILYINQDVSTTEKGKMLRLAGTSIGAILCVAIFSAFFTTGYEVYLDGEKVAVVNSKAAFEKQFADANEKIVEIAGKGYGINKIPKYIFTVATRTRISDDDEIIKNVMAQSSFVNLVYYINVDGQEVACAQSDKQAKLFLEKATAVYGGKNKKILNDVKITPKYERIKYYFGEKTAVDSLLSVLKVQTESDETYLAEIACGKEEKLTDEMYVNEEKTVSKGKNGIMEVTARVTKINGMASKATVLSQEVVKQPVKEVVIVGAKDLPTVGTGEFLQPFYGTITSRFGARWGRTHTGTDIAGETGDPIKAADNGVVITAEYQENGYGNIIIIDHNNGFVTYYAHLNTIGVQVGDVVQKGAVIGELGNTGRSTGPHLHFEVRENGTPINPEQYLEDIN